MRNWILLLAGGVLGTAARYLLSGAAYKWFGTGFAYGTLAVNLSAAFAVGFLATLADKKFMLGPEFRLFWMIGFMGAYSTFSTLIYESWRYIDNGQVFLAALNLVGSSALGMAAFFGGYILASVL